MFDFSILMCVRINPLQEQEVNKAHFLPQGRRQRCWELMHSKKVYRAQVCLRTLCVFCVLVYVCLWVYVHCLSVCVCVHVYIHCVCVCVCVCVCAYVYVCIHVFVCVHV